MTLIVRTPEIRNLLIVRKERRNPREQLRAFLKLPTHALTEVFGSHTTVNGEPVDAYYFRRNGGGEEWIAWILSGIVREFGGLDEGAAWLKGAAK